MHGNFFTEKKLFRKSTYLSTFYKGYFYAERWPLKVSISSVEWSLFKRHGRKVDLSRLLFHKVKKYHTGHAGPYQEIGDRSLSY